MNTTQIKCFLALADTLNFTKAAEQLYLSQPSLSYQISAMERDLNTQLFIRDQKSVRLTPAAVLLAGELGRLEQQYESLVERVQSAGMGYSGSLTVGMLEGQWMGRELTDRWRRFISDYPNIDFRIQLGSFGDLRRKLVNGEIDVAVTLSFDVEGMPGVVRREVARDTAVLAVSRLLPIGQKEVITPEDICGETILIISPEDSPHGAEGMRRFLREMGSPRRVRSAPNLSTMMLWIEAASGIGAISTRSSLAGNPEVRLIHEVPLDRQVDMASVAVWRKDNLNPAIPLFDQAL